VDPPLDGEVAESPDFSVQGEEAPKKVSRRFNPSSREVIANQLVTGTPHSEIASLHNCDVADISKLARSRDMKDRVERRRTQLLESSSKIMFKWLLHADRLADDQLKCALSSGPDQYRARTWILDRVSPSRSVNQQQVEINHNINHEVMVGINEAIREVNKAIPTEALPEMSEGTLLDGSTALPPLDYAMDEDS
jgi:hypothetical protein